MKTIKFLTKVSEDGTIKIPNNLELNDKEVEVFIVLKKSTHGNKVRGADFIQKWAGFLNDSNTDNSRYEYLSEKYK